MNHPVTIGASWPCSSWCIWRAIAVLAICFLLPHGNMSQTRAMEPGRAVDEAASETETADSSSSLLLRTRVEIPSSIDQSPQPSYIITPADYADSTDQRPLLVSLHSWSADVEQRNVPLEQLAARRGWLLVAPHFRGVNNHPDACGSPLAQQDILDAVDWAVENYRVDETRIYLTGSSGGGHMTLLMAGRHPDRWSAASAWVPISDLAAWHASHADGNYGRMMRNCCGGPPGESDEVDRQYRERSPLTYLAGVGDLPVDIAAGIHDGHDGSVSIDHSLRAFNRIAASREMEEIGEDEIAQLLRPQGRLEHPRPSDQVHDESFGREIHLRRTAGNSRVTIFEGGHEGIARAAVEWLATHSRPTASRRESTGDTREK